MNEILIWVEENLGVLLTGTGLASIVAYITYWFTTKKVPKLLNGIISMFAKLVSNLFGVSYGEGEDLVNALPIVKNMTDMTEQVVLNAEMKLLELKEKLTSSAYSAQEKKARQLIFNYLYNKFKNDISPEVLAILQELEELNA